MITSINQLPPDLREMCRLIQQRDEADIEDVLTQLNDAVDELRSICSDEHGFDSFDESTFMQDHFGLEPDYFPSILDLVNTVK
jgi:hypothetical protein